MCAGVSHNVSSSWSVGVSEERCWVCLNLVSHDDSYVVGF